MRGTLIKWVSMVAVGGILTGTALVGLSPSLGACTRLEITESTPQTLVEARLGQGWYSDPTDGAERLYAPSCHH